MLKGFKLPVQEYLMGKKKVRVRRHMVEAYTKEIDVPDKKKKKK
jgi:hypothetical protein